MTAQIFAPGIVSTEKNLHSPAIFSKDGKELFWSYHDNGNHVIMHMRQIAGTWTSPRPWVHGGADKDGNPFYSADGTRLIFHSARRGTRPDGKPFMDFWFSSFGSEGWSEPALLAFQPQSDRWQLYGCQSADGDLYFTSKENESSRAFQLYYAPFNGKTWEEAVKLPAPINASAVNWTPYVSPHETYLIFSSDRQGPQGDYNACDLYISFRVDEEKWGPPINLGPTINTDEIERFPWVSPDGRYLFFVRGFGNIYWIDAKIIGQIKERHHQNLMDR